MTIFQRSFPFASVLGSMTTSEYIYFVYHNYMIMHQITILEALFLGLVQGFTEWLPISSSGHLVIFQSLLGISVPPEFDIVIMMGTIAALILYFREKIFTAPEGYGGIGTTRHFRISD